MKPFESWPCQVAAGLALAYAGYKLGQRSNSSKGKDVPDYAGKSFRQAKGNAVLEVGKIHYSNTIVFIKPLYRV